MGDSKQQAETKKPIFVLYFYFIVYIKSLSVTYYDQIQNTAESLLLFFKLAVHTPHSCSTIFMNHNSFFLLLHTQKISLNTSKKGIKSHNCLKKYLPGMSAHWQGHGRRDQVRVVMVDKQQLPAKIKDTCENVCL